LTGIVSDELLTTVVIHYDGSNTEGTITKVMVRSGGGMHYKLTIVGIVKALQKRKKENDGV
jgi:hypothetical protein